MGTVYKIRLAFGEIAKVILTPKTRNRYQLGWIQVPPKFRGKGISSYLMRHVLADADRYGITLSLVAVACAGLTQEVLETWYEKWGFEQKGYDAKLRGTKMSRAPKQVTSRYRRNVDSGLREAERHFLSDMSANSYTSYLSVCQRAGVSPAYCLCGKGAAQPCAYCTAQLQIPVWHCLECLNHLCAGSVTTEDGSHRCNSDLRNVPRCPHCEEIICQNDKCDQHRELQECKECGKDVCDHEDCSVACNECGVVVCKDCWFECGTHDNNRFCDDCTSLCDVCGTKDPNECCPQCVCKEDDGVSICNTCIGNDSAAICHHCEGRLCEKHTLKCVTCEENVCEEDSKRCALPDPGQPWGKKCGAAVCDNCDLTTCEICDKVKGCPAHFEECAECERACCDSCAEECAKCGVILCEDCLEEHQPGCQEQDTATAEPQLPELIVPPTAVLQEGSRVRHSQTGIQGTVIKIGEKDGIKKCIVEWDDDTAGKYLLTEIVGPLRKYYRRYY